MISNKMPKQWMICSMMKLAMATPIAFLEWNCFCWLNELLRVDKDPNVPIQGCMDRPNETKPPSIKGYGLLTSWRLIWCLYISLEWTWKCDSFSKFGYVKPMVSHRQELLMGFIHPLVLSIFLQDGFQKWGPTICYMEGRIWFSFDRNMLCRR